VEIPFNTYLKQLIFAPMYYLLLGIATFLSWMPFRVLYVISDFFAFLSYNVIGYRKQVVLGNLAIAFPEKSDRERSQIAKRFFKNFFDTFLEAFKLLSLSESEFQKRYTGNNEEFKRLLEQSQKNGKSVQVHLGHHFNWEWTNIYYSNLVPIPFLGVYMPITSEPVERLFKKIRQRGKTVLIKATEMRSSMLPYRKESYLLALVADQNPGSPERAHWLNFFGKKTPFVVGPEKGARMNDTSVYFAKTRKLRRGHYHTTILLEVEDPGSLPEGELTRRYVKFLEQAIREDPANYLWSHKRWKYEWKDEYQDMWIGE
jgi:Kdo2-lipid IVA lauroyltransferase/acyltransferase